MIRQGLVHLKKIGPPAFESSYYISSWDIVPTLPYPAGDPAQRQLRRSEPNIDDLDQITSILPILETLRVVQAAQRTLKSELRPRFDQAVKFSQDQAAGHEMPNLPGP